jgi:superfamily II DNA/RNA helicase
MLSLWESQKKALEGGLIGEKSLVLAMPTSSGKTRTVELAIFDKLKSHPKALCVYVVPTRALAAEVEDSLSSRLGRMGIGVSVLYGGYDFSPFEQAMLDENQVIVLTPEKLDLLMRQSDDFRQRISLAIVDEVQEVTHETNRSMRMELILSRLFSVVEKNKARVLCLSGVIKNPQDFSHWISGSDSNLVETVWRPTVQRFGQFQWYRRKGRPTGQIRYPPMPNEFPTDDFYVPLPFRQYDLQYEDGRKTEIAARISLFYSRTGSTLVFTTTKALVQKIATITSAILKENPPAMTEQRAEMVDECAAILGKQHELLTAIKLGFCFHHGELPRSIRRILEAGIRNGALPLIISTTTLTEGVNLPIKNVVVHSLDLYNEISAAQFWNAAGRAGRAGYETEGHIVFCFEEDRQRILAEEAKKSESAISSAVRLLIETGLPSANGPDGFLRAWSLASTSQFRKEWDSFASWGNVRKRHALDASEEILSTLDSQLLAWIIEDNIDKIEEKTAKQWVAKTLFFVQTIDLPDAQKKFTAGVRHRAHAVRAELEDEEERLLYNRTGMTVRSNKRIAAAAKELLSILPKLDDTDRLTPDVCMAIHKSLEGVAEVSKLGKIDSKLLSDWVEGEEYSTLANKYYDGNIEKTVADIESATMALPWGAHALIQHLKALLSDDEISSLVANVPSLLYNGVPTLAAVYAINLGARDRRVAIKLGDAYLKEHTSLSFEDFGKWLRSIGYGKWVEILSGESLDVINDCFERVTAKPSKAKGPGLLLEFSVPSISDVDEMDCQDLIVVRHQGEFWLMTFDYRTVARLDGPNVSHLEKVDRTEQDVIVESWSKSEAVVTVRVV